MRDPARPSPYFLQPRLHINDICRIQGLYCTFKASDLSHNAVSITSCSATHVGATRDMELLDSMQQSKMKSTLDSRKILLVLYSTLLDSDCWVDDSSTILAGS